MFAVIIPVEADSSGLPFILTADVYIVSAGFFQDPELIVKHPIIHKSNIEKRGEFEKNRKKARFLILIMGVGAFLRQILKISLDK